MIEPISLRQRIAACLDALRAGCDRTALIAVHATQTIPQARQALVELESLGLAAPASGRRWVLTPSGQRAPITIGSAARSRGRPSNDNKGVPGAGETRLLARLDRPRRGNELADLLGVTRQRVHQLVIKLFARGLIRCADPHFPTYAVAAVDHPAILLRQDQERVLSAFQSGEATTVSKLAAATSKPTAKVLALVRSLCEVGLIEPAGTSRHGELYRMTRSGAAHWQRSAGARQVVPLPPPFRSDRVRDVLALLQRQGATRTCDIGRELDVPQQSMNALMQYLKRNKAVRTETDAYFAPYVLTPGGREMLAAMDRVRPGPDADPRLPARPAANASPPASIHP